VATLSGGAKMEAYLAKIADRMTGELAVGFLEGATYPDDAGTPVAQVAFWNEYGTSRSPARPFFRTMIAKEADGWVEVLARAAKHYQYDSQKVMGAMGEVIKGQLQQSITGWSAPPNAPYTVSKKGFNKPLIDTGHMLNSIDYTVTSE
jgi:hypothetical protein